MQSHSNGVQFADENTLFIKGVPKLRMQMVQEAVIKVAGAKAVNSVVDRDPLCQNAFLIYANYTSAGDAKRGQYKLERWLDDKWHYNSRPSISIKGAKALNTVTYSADQTLVLKPVAPERKELLETAVVKMTDPKNLHSVIDRDQTIPGALLMYANYASVDETHLAQDRMERWLDANWEWADRPAVAVKSEQQEIYFGIHVAGLPSEADEKDIEHFFSQFGTFLFLRNAAQALGARWRRGLAPSCRAQGHGQTRENFKFVSTCDGRHSTCGGSKFGISTCRGLNSACLPTCHCSDRPASRVFADLRPPQIQKFANNTYKNRIKQDRTEKK